ncbi:MAG: hypothetical protein IT198_17385 [Acidimicrobiia bacterium]|nr:hypothetical protein [Acidimicrobiia bacterium]
MTTRAEREFHADMVNGADRLKREIGYNPTRFNQMVGELGGPEAARRLLTGRDTSDGFTTLWENHRLDMTVEAFALLPWYAELFTDEQRGTARRRLTEHGFDVDSFLRSRSVTHPDWAADGAD